MTAKTTLVGALALLAALAAFGCSFEKKHEDERYEYSYDVNGCPTGDHSFKSKSAYCAALKDEALNKGCAQEIRAKTFADECD